MNHLEARHHLEQLDGQMIRASAAARRHIDLVGVGLCVSDEFWNGVGRNRWIDLHDIGHAHDAGHRREVTHKIEIEPLIKSRVNGIRWIDQKERVAICRPAGDCLRGNISASTWAVLDNKLLGESLRQPLTNKARRYVDSATR